MTTQITTLDSGLRVVTEHVSDVRSVALGFWVGTGSRDEAPAFAGASHFLEHLLFKGTPSRSAREIAESIDAVGGDLNAFTTKEFTAFYLRVLFDSLGMGLGVLSDIIRTPAFRPTEVEAERQVILEEILMQCDEPSDLVHDRFLAALFPGHALGREVLGDAGTISAMGRDDIAGFFEQHYRPANMVLAAAGRLDHDELVDAVAADFDGEAGGAPVRGAPESGPEAVSITPRDTEQAHLVVGMRALDRDDDDRYALGVLNHALGGGVSSRLFQEIREERGLAYSVYSYTEGYADAGAVAVYAGTAPGRVTEVLDLLHLELDRLIEGNISAHELDLAKGHLVGSMALSLEDTGARMSRIGRSLLVHGEIHDVDEVVARTQRVTLDDVARVIDRVLTGDRVLAVVGPFDSGAFDGLAA